jgi:5-methylcytosine-specific restriction protein A
MGRLTSLKPRVAPIQRRTPEPPKVADGFYLTREWRVARDLCVALHNWMCAKCRRSGCRLFVDHIQERKDGGALYEQSNLEPLCGSCHTAKTHGARVRRQAMRPG